MFELLPELKQPPTLIAFALAAVLLYFQYLTTALLLPVSACLFVSQCYSKDVLWAHKDTAEKSGPKKQSLDRVLKRELKKKKKRKESKDTAESLNSYLTKNEVSTNVAAEEVIADPSPDQKAEPDDEVADTNCRPPIRTKSDTVHIKSLDTDDSDDGKDEDQDEEPGLVRTKDSCRNCWSAGTSICRRCNRIKYCSKECQREHWPIHKQFCGKDDAALRQMWSMMWPECSQKKGDMSRHRAFVEHVGGHFWCTDNGWRILHSLVSLSAVLKQFPEEHVLMDYCGLIQDTLDLGADVNDKTDVGDTALHMALRDGTNEALVLARYLLEFAPVDIRIRNRKGETAEDLCRDEECKKLLSQKRAELDEADRKKAEELARAEAEKQARAKTEKRDCTEVEAEVCAQGTSGKHPKSESKTIENAGASVKINKPEPQLQRIARPKASKDRCRECGESGRLICRRCRKAKYCSQDCQRKNWPIHKGFCGKTEKDLNTLWNDLCSKCMENKGDTTQLRHFCRHAGGDFRVDPDGGWEVLHNLSVLSYIMSKYPGEETKEQFLALLKDAVDYGADVNAQTKLGDTPLHMACYRENCEGYEMVKFLLEHTAVDVRIKNKADRTARESCQDRAVWDLFADKVVEAKRATEKELLEKKAAAVSHDKDKDELSSLSDASEGDQDDYKYCNPLDFARPISV